MIASMGLPEYEHFEVSQLARSKANLPPNPVVRQYRFAMIIIDMTLILNKFLCFCIVTVLFVMPYITLQICQHTTHYLTD